MATFATEIKRVYSEGLSKYGFKKIKGKQPYFVRPVGDEIVHIITYKTEKSFTRGYKRFVVYGGIATVYRAHINLEKTPRDNSAWLYNVYKFYKRSDAENKTPDMYDKLTTFSYKEEDKEAMINSIKYSFEMTEKFVIPQLDKVINIKECVDFFDKYNTPLLYIDEKDFGKGQNGYDYMEGLLNIFVYTFDEYAEKKRKAHEKWNEIILNDMKIGRNGFTMEEYEIDKEEGRKSMECQINTFKKMINDSEEHRKLMEEIESRKDFNIEILRNYGIDI
ncbi:MAG: hypothetical protein K2M73_11140 [Lachnospiraceae bacterium]|nr:hypothetical protein [Lachnospiraceae bacterium]